MLRTLCGVALLALLGDPGVAHAQRQVFSTPTGAARAGGAASLGRSVRARSAGLYGVTRAGLDLRLLGKGLYRVTANQPQAAAMIDVKVVKQGSGYVSAGTRNLRITRVAIDGR
jgi:hypothetical protein